MKIGIIDDDVNEINSIQRTILTIKNKNDLNVKELIKNLIKTIIKDISKFEISLLIIDHKIVVNTNEKLNGSDIFEQIRKVTPDFPTIIMTNVVEDSLKNFYVDPDKVYAKSEFFKIREYAKEKTENIIRNIERYEKLRNNTQQELEILKNKLLNNTENQKIVDEIVEKEKELDKYFPIQKSYLEEVIDSNELREILKLIEEVNEMLEKK